jgi:hypothetical protein
MSRSGLTERSADVNQPFIVRGDQKRSGGDRWISRSARINGYMSTNQSAPRPVALWEPKR